MGQLHTMLYEASAATLTAGTPITLQCVNDPNIKPAATFGKAKLKGILGLQFGYDTGAAAAVACRAEFRNSNDIRSLKFFLNHGKYVNSAGNYINAKALDRDTVGYIEGHDRILSELTTNEIIVTPSANWTPTTGVCVFQVFVFLEYDGVHGGIDTDESPDKSTVSFDVTVVQTALPLKTWNVAAYGDPGFVPGAKYAIKAFDLQTSNQPLGMVARVRGLSSQAGLEMIVPLQMLGVSSTGQFIPKIAPVFEKQAVEIATRAPEIAAAGVSYGLSLMSAEYLTDKNAVA